MQVVIYKDGEYQKEFFKWFTAFAGINKWVETHFKTATKKIVDKGTNKIYIFFGKLPENF